MNMNSLEILKAVDALYSDESKWTKGAFGRDTDGVSTGSFNDAAVRWCALGAIRKVCGSIANIDDPQPLEARTSFAVALGDVHPVVGLYSLTASNDAAATTFADIKAALKLAIERKEQENVLPNA